MNQINPLHIGALLLVVIMFLFLKLHGLQKELVEAKEEYKASKELAVDVSSLKALYANKQKTQSAIERILEQRILQSANIKVEKKRKSIKISAKSIDAKGLNFLMGKILNGTYNITQLHIKRLNQTDATLEMEIQW